MAIKSNRKKLGRGRLRGKIIRNLFLSMFLSVLLFLIGSIVIYVATGDGEEAIQFADHMAEEAPEEVEDIRDIYMWSGWEDMNSEWKVEVYDSSEKLVYTNDTYLIMPSLWIRTEKKFDKLGGHIVINSITGKKTQVYMEIFHLISWLMFFVFFTLLFRKTEKYTYEISDGISILAGGEMNHRIEIKGKDELSMIATNINCMAEALQLRTNEKDKSDRERDDVITNLAHDIRTPITVLEGYLSMLMNDENLSKEKQKEYLDISLNKCNELTHRADNIFEYVRLNNKKEHLSTTFVGARQYITEKLEETAMILASEGFEFKVDIELDDEVKIFIDKNITQRVFDNLLSNIIKYADNKYPIELRAVHDEDIVKVFVRNKAKDKIKMDADRLFERTVSGDESRNKKSEGLGLAICKLIMEMQNGKISAEVEDEFIEFTLNFLN